MHTLTIRKTINFTQEFSTFAGYAFDKIAKYLNSVNALFGGAAIVCFHNVGSDYNEETWEKLNVEIGFPVARPISGKEDITANTIPSQKVVSAIDLGPYEKQDPTFEEILAWIKSNGCEMQGDIYHQYLNDTERPESELLQGWQRGSCGCAREVKWSDRHIATFV